jgi:hypothetical protein
MHLNSRLKFAPRIIFTSSYNTNITNILNHDHFVMKCKIYHKPRNFWRKEQKKALWCWHTLTLPGRFPFQVSVLRLVNFLRTDWREREYFSTSISHYFENSLTLWISFIWKFINPLTIKPHHSNMYLLGNTTAQG